jgi:hypothetical protein
MLLEGTALRRETTDFQSIRATNFVFFFFDRFESRATTIAL